MSSEYFLFIVTYFQALMLLKIRRILCHYQKKEKLNYAKTVENEFVWLRKAQ